MNRKKLSKIMSMAAVFAVCSSMLSCSSEKKENGGNEKTANQSGESAQTQSGEVNENGEQIIDIAFAGLNVMDEIYTTAVNRFNRQYDGQYEAVLRRIENTEMSKDFSQAINMEIVSGNSPDILGVHDYSLLRNLAGKGALTDMYTLIDSESSPLAREDFFSNFLTASEVEGKLISMAPGFWVSTAMAKQKNVPGINENWSVDDFIALYDSLPDDVFITIGASDPVANLYSFVYRNTSRYIDYTTGECFFNGDEFISLLEATKNFTGKGDSEYEYDPNVYAMDKAIVEFTGIHTEDSFKAIKENTFAGEEIVLVGIPSYDGKGGSFSYGDTFGIMEASDCKEGAWLFIEELLGDKHYEDIANIYFSPLEKNLNIGDKQLDTYLRSIEQAVFYDYDIMDIIEEEAAYYYNGERTVQECAEIINNRVSIKIAEQTWQVG